MKASKHFAVTGTLAIAFACAVGLAACGTGSTTTISGVAATVNGTEISEQQVADYISDYRTNAGLESDDDWGEWLATYGTTPSEIRDDVIDYYVEVALVEQAAEEYEVTVSDEDVQAEIDTMKSNYSSEEAWQSALSSAGTTEEEYTESVRIAMLESGVEDAVCADVAEPTDEEVLSYVQLYASYLSGAKRSSHILFSADDEATAQTVLDQINAGTLSFEDAAAQYSTDTASAEDGGDVGWDALNSFVDEYTDALDGLEAGQVSGLVTSDYGIHIIKCTEVFTAPDEITSLDQVPEGIVSYIRSIAESSAESSAYETWFDEYKEAADIQTNDMPEGLPYDVDMTQYEDADEDDSSSDTTTDETGETDATDETSSEDATTEDSSDAE